jgi:magnesium transporter
LDHVAEELGLHALAIEDALEARQRPKLDRYADHQFLSMYGVALDRATGQLQLHELAAFITATALVTVRKDDAFDLDDVVVRWDESIDLARYGVGFLLYGLIDHVVDGHFDAVQALDDEIEELEDLLFESRLGRRMCSDVALRCVRAWSLCAESCCRCARSSTRSCVATSASSPRK